jgi:hypothetical protein
MFRVFWYLIHAVIIAHAIGLEKFLGEIFTHFISSHGQKEPKNKKEKNAHWYNFRVCISLSFFRVLVG